MGTSFSKLLSIWSSVYRLPDDRLYDLPDFFYYHQKWLLRYIDEKKRGEKEAATLNLIVSFAWYLAIVSRFDFDLQTLLEKRYPWKCPFCLEIPCNCQANEKRKSKKTGRPVSGKPKDIQGWQEMIKKIYPPEIIEVKNLEILRSQDSLHQTFRRFRQLSAKRSLHVVEIASVDYFVEVLKVANDLDIDLAEEFTAAFKNGCFVCKKTPCECFYTE